MGMPLCPVSLRYCTMVVIPTTVSSEQSKRFLGSHISHETVSLPRMLCSVGWNSSWSGFSLLALTACMPTDVCLLESSKGKPVTAVLHALGVLKWRHVVVEPTVGFC